MRHFFLLLSIPDFDLSLLAQTSVEVVFAEAGSSGPAFSGLRSLRPCLALIARLASWLRLLVAGTYTQALFHVGFFPSQEGESLSIKVELILLHGAEELLPILALTALDSVFAILQLLEEIEYLVVVFHYF